MPKQRLVFEGFYDNDSGWEFDLPVYLMRPVRRLYIGGSGEGKIQDLIEDYVIDVWNETEIKGEDGPDSPIDFNALERDLILAQEGRNWEGVTYFLEEVEFDEDPEWGSYEIRSVRSERVDNHRKFSWGVCRG